MERQTTKWRRDSGQVGAGRFAWARKSAPAARKKIVAA
jgi:hypothetical protein